MAMPQRRHKPHEATQAAGPEEIARAVDILRTGGVVAFPTETVYGLGADAQNAEAIERVFALKGRPSTNPLIVHVSGEEMAHAITTEWPDEASKLAKAFWPGPLTIVLPKKPSIPDSVTAGLPNVAVRAPDHHVTLALLEAFEKPLVGPSANPSGRISPTTTRHVREGFPRGEDVYILEGGPCKGGLESTVVTLAESPPRILRPGLIGAEELSIVIGHPLEEPKPLQVAGGTAAPSPGLQPIHYAPIAPAVVFDRTDFAEVLASAPRIVVLTHSNLAPRPPHYSIPMPAGPSAYAARLYSALHEADSLRPKLIAVERPPGSAGPIWTAVADRLSRAAKPFKS